MTTATPSQTEKLDDVPHFRLDSESILENAYQIGEKIGQGSFGKVYKVTEKKTGEIWAMKCISKQKSSSSAPIQLFEREVAILKRVRHENIIMLKEVYETHDKVFLIMEYCSGGELGKHLIAAVKFDEPVVKNIMTSLVSAISYLHKCGVVHRDLKLSNILLSEEPKNDKNFFIKVTDFGLSVVKEGVRPENMLNSFCGTLNYMAPEIAENKNYSQQCDVWAMGIIAYQLLCGYPPFSANDEKELIKKIKIGKIVFNSPEWDNVSSEAQDFVKKLLHIDPSYRLTAPEALQNTWLTGIENDDRQSSNVLELMTYWQEDLKKDHLKKNSDSSFGSKDSRYWSENEAEDSESICSKETQLSNSLKSPVPNSSLSNYPVLPPKKLSNQPKLSGFLPESFGSSSSRKMSKKKD